MDTRTREQRIAALRRGLEYAKRQVERNQRSARPDETTGPAGQQTPR